uniref:Uncharacterized protein n=1 Tax=Zea mays TaxID=4577 RepID=C0HHH6_MAIZE|nr:unknown [Zea mays]
MHPRGLHARIHSAAPVAGSSGRRQVRLRPRRRRRREHCASGVREDGQRPHAEAGAAGGDGPPVAAERGGGDGHRPQPFLLRPRAPLRADHQVIVNLSSVVIACVLPDSSAWCCLCPRTRLS